VVKKQVLCTINCRQAQVASVTAAGLQVAERHGGDCKDVESFAVPPTSDDEFILPKAEMEPVISGTAGTLKTVTVRRYMFRRAALWGGNTKLIQRSDPYRA
jgi:hypothetical protein